MTTISPATTSGTEGPVRWSFAAIAFCAGWACVLAALWIFPRFWYSHAPSDAPAIWLSEVTNAPGWRLEIQAVDKSAEAALAADAVFLGEYSRDGRAPVRLFTAHRFQENPNEIGLFVHTPDRCWTEAGWRLEPAAPDVVETEVHGVRIDVERRVFAHPSGARELVYFFGLVAGRTLPYRLDHNLGVGRRLRPADAAATAGTALRASDSVLWTRVWESFRSRRPLLGPKEFVRVSTPLAGTDAATADRLLLEALPQLLERRAFSGR